VPHPHLVVVSVGVAGLPATMLSAATTLVTAPRSTDDRWLPVIATSDSDPSVVLIRTAGRDVSIRLPSIRNPGRAPEASL
jgi:hypothetical protein